ncbi:hypothetical protein C2G38_2102952 [Gigaspora rosea]|uniref:Aerolysin-like C-terminal domain-containing protein n=1 Tax=Gigaspora rosea TaxID=44941 RepID=A0A397UNG9_9GLOM|nr:hypothetical protein C2G38_2102952 [Gigaspora rosea]
MQGPHIFEMEKTVTTTKTFNWDYSFSIGIETKFKAGVPLIAENETTVKVETGFTVGGSQSDSDTTKFRQTFTVNAQPKTITRAMVTVMMVKADTPYSATVSRVLTDSKGNRTEYTYEIYGIFEGTNAFNINCVMDEFPLKE